MVHLAIQGIIAWGYNCSAMNMHVWINSQSHPSSKKAILPITTELKDKTRGLIFFWCQKYSWRRTGQSVPSCSIYVCKFILISLCCICQNRHGLYSSITKAAGECKGSASVEHHVRWKAYKSITRAYMQSYIILQVPALIDVPTGLINTTGFCKYVHATFPLGIQNETLVLAIFHLGRKKI